MCFSGASLTDDLREAAARDLDIQLIDLQRVYQGGSRRSAGLSQTPGDDRVPLHVPGEPRSGRYRVAGGYSERGSGRRSGAGASGRTYS